MKHIISRRLFIAAATCILPLLASPALSADKLKVAGIHASPVENAWNSRIHQALQSAADDGVIEYVFSEGISGTDYARAMREYAEQGHDLIWGESYAVENEARQVAKDYPDVAFLMGSSGGPSGDNFGVFGTRNHEAAFLAGMLAVVRRDLWHNGAGTSAQILWEDLGIIWEEVGRVSVSTGRMLNPEEAG